MEGILQNLKMQFGPESVARFLGESIPKFIGAALVLTLFFCYLENVGAQPECTGTTHKT